MRWSLLLIAFGVGCGNAPEAEVNAEPSIGATMQRQCTVQSSTLPDSLVAPSGDFVIRVGPADAGRKVVEVSRVAGDTVVASFSAGVLDIQWLPGGNAFVYAVAPIYDSPGVYRMEVPSGKTERLVEPELRDEAYPDGADWLRVCGVDRDESSVLIHVGRFGHVDEIDFSGSPRPTMETVRLPVETEGGTGGGV